MSLVRPEEGAVFDLSSRSKFRVSGPDAARYLNGQISNDLLKASEQRVIHACVLTAKGRINADVFIRREGDAFLIDSDPEVRESLAARLERYIIADDVRVEDLTDEFALLHTISSLDAFCSFCDTESFIRPGGGRVEEVRRFGYTGVDVFVAANHRRRILAEVGESWPTCDAECAETFRVERGIPRWGRELSEEIIPVEANLEAEAIDYAKGCYIGQEVISRMKMSGQTNKRLCGFIALDGALAAGMKLHAEDGKEVGWITSAVNSARLGKQIALGYLKRGFHTPGSEFTASSEGANARVQVVPLPFL